MVFATFSDKGVAICKLGTCKAVFLKHRPVEFTGKDAKRLSDRLFLFWLFWK